MRYRKDLKIGNELSVLGFGCMRLPRSINARIDIDKTEKLIMSAIDKGINYFDTAYIYGGSEQALGEVFKRNPGSREKINLATKLPFYQCKSYEDFDRLFDTQLKNLNTDYIDYYLIHNISSLEAWQRVVSMGIENWIEKNKNQGKIRPIHFSFHGIQREFLALLDVYDWDFCQMQYNYMNENYQAGTKGLLRAYEKGLSVVIMEPLLGGKLATGLPREAVNVFKAANGSITPAAWALRWVWNHKEVTLLLSGMNSMEQLNDNIKTAETAEAGMLSQEETDTISKAVGIVEKAYKIPCTGCNYCMPCPKGVNIPGSFAAYNVSYAVGYLSGIQQYMTSIGVMNPEKNFSGRRCVKCGRCETKCPQHIKIMESLTLVTKRMEPFWLRGALNIFERLR